MNKQLVIQKILAKLEEDRDVLVRAARESRTEATDESSKAEDKYDTRGLEASYLAGGQSRLAEEAGQALKIVQRLALLDFAPGDEITIGALVEVKSKKQSQFYFLSPRGGGIQVEVEGKTIVVLTPQSRLGQMLVDRVVGDSFTFEQGGSELEYRIVSLV